MTAFKNVIKVVNLGRMGYQPALRIQKLLEKDCIEPQQDTHHHFLLIVQHDPVYTFGLREAVEPNISEKLTKLGAEVIHTNRGGLTTFHGPGQLVAYPIINLLKFGRMTLRKYVETMEDTAIHTCRMLGVPAEPNTESASHTGAWVNGNKICAIGVHCKRYVTTHGLALNCDVDLGWFDHITPCGIPDKGVTSLSSELEECISVEEALPQFLTSFQTMFSCSLVQDDQLAVNLKNSAITN